MSYYAAAGTTVAVSATLPSSYDDDSGTGYPSLTFTTVGELTQVPEFGSEYTLITHNPLDTRVTGKLKGSVNYGSVALALALDDADAGQDILRDFADGDNVDEDLAFKITFGDSGAVRYFTAKVLSFKESAGGVDEILGATAQIEINRPIVRVSGSS